MFLNQIIIREEKSRKFLADMRKKGVDRYTVVRANGTASSELLKNLGLDEKTMELIVCYAEREKTNALKELAINKYHFETEHSGVYFSTDLNYKKGDKMEAVAIHVIVDRGLADDVIDIAEKAGASGATVLHGRGSGIEKRVAIFDMVIEPEKDIILLVTSLEQKDKVIDAINKGLDIDSTSKGVIFTMPVTDAVGFNFNR